MVSREVGERHASQASYVPGLLTVGAIQNVTPDFANDASIKDYLAFMKQCNPDAMRTVGYRWVGRFSSDD